MHPRGASFLFMTEKLLALRGFADAVPHTAGTYFDSSRSASGNAVMTLPYTPAAERHACNKTYVITRSNTNSRYKYNDLCFVLRIFRKR